MPDDAPVISTIRSRTASSIDPPRMASSRLSPYSGAFRVIELGRFSACETAPTGLPIRSKAAFAGFIVGASCLVARRQLFAPAPARSLRQVGGRGQMVESARQVVDPAHDSSDVDGRGRVYDNGGCNAGRTRVLVIPQFVRLSIGV